MAQGRQLAGGAARPAKLPTDIRANLEAENAYADAMLAPTRAAATQAAARKCAPASRKTISIVPAADGPYAYFERYREGGQHPLICRRPREARPCTGADRRRPCWQRASPSSTSATRRIRPTTACSRGALDDKGSEFFSIHVRDIEDRARPARRDPRHRRRCAVDPRLDAPSTMCGSTTIIAPAACTCHVVGTDPETDELVFEDQDPRWFVHITRMQSGNFGVIEVCRPRNLRSAARRSSRARRPSRASSSRARTGFATTSITRRTVSSSCTNDDGAEDFKIVEAPVSDPRRRRTGSDLIAHRRGCMIADLRVFKHHMVRLELEDGLPRIVVRDIRQRRRTRHRLRRRGLRSRP